MYNPDVCDFSGTHISRSEITDPTIHVECPQCGARRKIPAKLCFDDCIVYPRHAPLDRGSSRNVKHWRRCFDGAWFMVEKYEVAKWVIQVLSTFDT